MMVVYRHCQHTFQYNQLVKVHVPIYDPFNKKNNKKKVYCNPVYWHMPNGNTAMSLLLTMK